MSVVVNPKRPGRAPQDVTYVPSFADAARRVKWVEANWDNERRKNLAFELRLALLLRDEEHLSTREQALRLLIQLELRHDTVDSTKLLVFELAAQEPLLHSAIKEELIAGSKDDQLTAEDKSELIKLAKSL